jgi:ABC-type methionine transport system ATPase subunit
VRLNGRIVIYQCGLRQDLALLEAGDLTDVGEKGVTLSGGQKARIALARAVYSSAETVLLDDVLAALVSIMLCVSFVLCTNLAIQDVHTAAWIVNKCLNGDLLRGRTVVLVTHNVALVAPLVAFVVSMGTGGRVAAVGTPAQIVMKNQTFAEQVVHEQAALALEAGLENEPLLEHRKVGAQGAKLVVAEDVQRGNISWDAFKLYFGSVSKRPLLYLATCFTIAG